MYLSEMVNIIKNEFNKIKHQNNNTIINLDFDKLYLDFSITHIVIDDIDNLDMNLQWKFKDIDISKILGGFKHDNNETKSILFKLECNKIYIESI